MSPTTIHKIFIAGMVWRIIYNSFKTLLGLALLKEVHVPIYEVVHRLMSHSFIIDPFQHLLYKMYLYYHLHQVPVTYFVAFYLIFWGVVDIVLSYSMIKRQIWAFPVTLWLTGAFVSYEVVRLFSSHSKLLFFVILFDLLIFFLIRHEYHKLKTKIARETA